MVSDFPPSTSSNYEDLLVEYLQVYIPEERELMLSESKDLHDGCLKSDSSSSDNDSGHGSCDSHTLLMDKCGETKQGGERQTDEERMGMEVQRHQNDWKKEGLPFGPDMSSGRVKTWPSVFSPLPQYNSSPLNQQSSLEMTKQHYLSDSLFPSGSTSPYLSKPGDSTKEALGPSYLDFCLSDKQQHLLHPQMQVQQQLQAHSDVNISRIGHKQAPSGLHSPALRSAEYVEVQRVNEEDMVLLQPVLSGRGRIEGSAQMSQGDDYSKVKGVDRDNMLLLQRDVTQEDGCDQQEANGVRGNCCTSSTATITQKPTGCVHTVIPLQDKTITAANGYVDTATMCTLQTH